MFENMLHSARTGLSGMNPLDWVIALVLAASTIAAFMKGLVRSLISLAGAIAGILIACLYAPQGAAYLARWVATPALAEIIAFVVILVGVWLLAALIGRLLRGACTAVGLGFLDRLAGAAFGFGRGVLLLAALLLPAAPYLPHFEEARGSMLLPYLLPAAHGISFVMPRDFGRHISDGDWLKPAKLVTTGMMRP